LELERIARTDNDNDNVLDKDKVSESLLKTYNKDNNKEQSHQR